LQSRLPAGGNLAPHTSQLHGLADDIAAATVLLAAPCSAGKRAFEKENVYWTLPKGSCLLPFGRRKKCAARLQVNLDFVDEADMVQMARLGIALQPIATALFANSPFRDGKPTGYLSWRSHVWTDTVSSSAGRESLQAGRGM
jgi:Glutamate-cysteine ligase family 2(GCS2)